MPQLPFPFHLYGLFIFLGFFFLYIYCLRNLESFSLKKNDFNSLFVSLIISSLLGARIYHVVSWLSYYKVFPGEIFSVWNGGLGLFGALIGGLIGVCFYCRRRKIKIMSVLNLIAPPLLLTQAIGRIGNFFNHEGFGPPTNLPLRVFIPVANRPIEYLDQPFFHPTFFYESIICSLFFLFFLYYKRKHLDQSSFFSFYLISYGLTRLITESLRLNTWIWGGLKAGYFFSFLMVLLGIILELLKRRKRLFSSPSK